MSGLLLVRDYRISAQRIDKRVNFILRCEKKREMAASGFQLFFSFY